MTDFRIHTIDSAPEGAKPVLAAAKGKFGFIPNLVAELAEAPVAAQAYLAVADAFASSSLSLKEQQVVLITTSIFHHCHYCVAAHSMVGKHAGLSDEALAALRDGRSVDDPRLEALRAFTHALVEKRGSVGQDTVDAFLGAGFTKAQILEVLVGITQKTLSNYTNHLANTPLDEAFEAFAWEPTSVG